MPGCPADNRPRFGPPRALDISLDAVQPAAYAPCPQARELTSTRKPPTVHKRNCHTFTPAGGAATLGPLPHAFVGRSVLSTAYPHTTPPISQTNTHITAAYCHDLLVAIVCQNTNQHSSCKSFTANLIELTFLLRRTKLHLRSMGWHRKHPLCSKTEGARLSARTDPKTQKKQRAGQIQRRVSHLKSISKTPPSN
jgi:hypothetical protein